MTMERKIFEISVMPGSTARFATLERAIHFRHAIEQAVRAAILELNPGAELPPQPVIYFEIKERDVSQD